MPIIIAIDDENNRWKRNEKKKRKKITKVIAKWSCPVFKVGFLQSVCKGFLIFESNLELGLSIILKENYMS